MDTIAVKSDKIELCLHKLQTIRDKFLRHDETLLKSLLGEAINALLDGIDYADRQKGH